MESLHFSLPIRMLMARDFVDFRGSHYGKRLPREWEWQYVAQAICSVVFSVIHGPRVAASLGSFFVFQVKVLSPVG